MYWLRSGNMLSPFFFLCIAGMFSYGGYLILRSRFQLRKTEIPLLSFGIGLTLYLWLANLAGHFLSSDLAFSLPALLILTVGLLLQKKSTLPPEQQPSWRIFLKQAGVLLILIFFFTLLGRGLAIFDERKNLTLISLMANGDIPAHNPLNPAALYQYHYGSQLLGASLVKIGGFFPWSAFDISKAIYWALCVILIYYTTRRFTRKNWAAIVLTGAYIFLSGSRFLLMLLPEQFLQSLDGSISLLGSSQDIGLPFSQALFADWVIGGGPPAGYSFGFLNGILKPLIMSHSGTETFALAIILMIFLLADSTSQKESKWLLAIPFAQLALTWETTYILVAIAVLLMVIFTVVKKTFKENQVLQTLLFSGLLSIPLVLLQGGTLTEMARNVLSGLFRSQPTVNAGITAGGIFQFVWPPVIFSGHLGALSVFDAPQLLAGLCEIGPAIFFIPAIWKWLKNQEEGSIRTTGSMLFISMLIGLLLPVFFTYPSSERDITRFSGYGLAILLLLFTLYLLDQGKSQKTGMRIVECISLLIMAAGGLVVGVEQLSGLNQPILAEGIDGWDARMSAQTWGKLDKGALVYDPSSTGWRSAVLSGNPTLLESSTYTQADYERLRDDPTLQDFQSYGFSYIYMDETWWHALDPHQRALFEQDCVVEVSNVKNDQGEILRSLFDIRACREGR